MGILSRTAYVIKSKINAILDRSEDPAETLDYSYEKMRDELEDVKSGIADLTTQKKRLEMQKSDLEDDIEKHNRQAKEAVKQGRDDLAERALEKKQTKMSKVDDLNAEIQNLQQTQDELTTKKEELQQKIEKFKTKKETIKAQNKAAEANVEVSEAISGVGDEMGDVSRTIERAEDNVEEKQARAEAMNELENEDVFDSVLSDKDSIDQELDELTDPDVSSELEDLKSETGMDNTDNTQTRSSEPESEELKELEKEVNANKQ